MSFFDLSLLDFIAVFDNNRLLLFFVDRFFLFGCALGVI